MKAALLVLVLAGAAHADEQLPKKCAAESPVDQPCTSIVGSYRIELAPRDKTCVVTKKAAATLKVTSEGRKPKFDAKALLKALGMTPAKDDPPELGADIREGVCCLDLRLYGKKGAKQQRVMVHMASGAKIVGAKADDRWYEERKDGSSDMCGDEDLDVTVTRLP